jgi:WD40 repeat protein
VHKLVRAAHGNRRFVFLRNLSGHTARVTAVTVCRSFSVIVSGSDDQTAILWDLNRLRFTKQVRMCLRNSASILFICLQLTGHDGAVVAVAVHELTGDITTCAGSSIHIWSINGDALLCKKTPEPISCIAMSRVCLGAFFLRCFSPNPLVHREWISWTATTCM